MNDPSLHHLRDALVASYETFRKRLTHRLGSDVLARDALHDVYIRLSRGGLIAADRPDAYLFRMAVNAATDGVRSRKRALGASDLDAALPDLPDPHADPLRALMAKQEIAILEDALEELTPRRRRILLDSRVHGRTLAQIAQALDLSQRMVEIELKYAVAHCAEKLGRQVVRRFGPQPRDTSTS